MLKSLSLLLLFQLIGIVIFCTGFFPQKNVLQGDATFEINKKFQENTKPPFKKLVLVVIDALRSDFIFDESKSGFNFVHSKLNSGEAWGFTAYSNPPTVTLPRLKGITTGSTPNFLDAILNVVEDDSSSGIKDQDSWPRQFHEHGYQMRFFGDDTWLKLLPTEIFNEYEGTNSFFVSDFEQVDLNVTRHIPKQLKETNDWDVLILHYLGLDHIGHKGGANSTFMPAKHREMDQVIEKLYKGMKDDTLMIVLGDHGMNDVGNHGGSSAGETSAALVFLSKKLSKYQKPMLQKDVKLPMSLEDPSTFQYLTSTQQMDLVPTISALFNVPIPKNNVGVLIPEFLQMMNSKIIDTKLLENYKQLMGVAKIEDNNLSEYIESKVIDRDLIINKMRSIQETLIHNATDYDYRNISIGYTILVLTTIFTVIFGIKKIRNDHSCVLIAIVSLLLGFSCFSSSFVEEEHQLWWWIITGSIAISYINSVIKGDKNFWIHFIIFCGLRLIRGWNNTGQKTVYSYVISNLLENKPIILWTLNTLTLFMVCLRGNSRDPLTFISTFMLGMMVLTYKVSWSIVNKEKVPDFLYRVAQRFCEVLIGEQENPFDNALIPLATLFFQCFIAINLRNILTVRIQRSNTLSRNVSKYITLLLVFLSSSTNIPQFLIFEILSYFIGYILETQYDSSIYLVSLVSLVLQNFTFFQFGGTNSIATIDLSNAYHGISENYNIYVIGVLMCLANFAPAIYWAMFSWNILYEGDRKKTEVFAKAKLPFIIFNSVVGCHLMAACFILRYHLFIWSVFSPKLCYFAGWTLFMNVIVGWALEGIMAILG